MKKYGKNKKKYVENMKEYVALGLGKIPRETRI